MKKNIKITLVVLILVALLLPITYSDAIEKVKNESFFEIYELEVTKDDKIEMTINLEKINYNKFVFELQSSHNMENIEIDNNKQLQNNENLEIEKNNNEIIIEIDKEMTNLNTIILYYQIPSTAKVNDIIKFMATVTNIESDEKEEEDETSNIENDKEETKTEIQTAEIEVKIVEKKDEQNLQQQENNNVQNNNKKDVEKVQDFKEEQQDNTEKIFAQSSNENSSKKIIGTNTTTMTTQKTEQTVTYNGSNNNYLSKLSVSGYTLNKEFSKDNSTYFITVENDVDLLDITATQEDETAIVCVYGNEFLSEGTNKILISVTAKNGNVRNYRIYVTKNF